MKIRPKIPIYQMGNKLWYSQLVDYNPLDYEFDYDTSRLYAGDVSNGLQNPWVSNLPGFDKGRYQPTTGYGAFGENKAHYNYVKGFEGDWYYTHFGQGLVENGKFTPVGEKWAKAVDELLPSGSKASFYDENGNIRPSWTTQYRDAHGRPARTFTDLDDYVRYVRNDQILGARHNLFAQRGKRYFYKDENGVEHWVDPKVIGNYTVSNSPVRETQDGTITWEDYELTGLKSPNDPPSQTIKEGDKEKEVDEGETEVGGGTGGGKNPEQGNSLLDRLRGMLPGLMSTGRLLGNIITTNKVYDEALKGIRPTLLQPYYTHRQVVGDEATKQAYYRRAAAGQTKAAQPFTSDADRQMAYMQEARRIGDELRAQGDLADNQEIRRTSDESNQHQWANTQRATEVANTNSASLNDANEKKHTLLAQKHAATWSSIDNYLKEMEVRKRQQMEEDDAYNKQIDLLEYETRLNNDPKLKEAYDALYALRDEDGKWDTNSEAFKIAKANYDKEQARIKLETLKAYRDINRKYKSPFFIKSGSKITYKKDDKLLYKSTKDVVDHFRRMCRRYPEKERKIQKLAPHPDGKRKYQVGGQFLAPFTIYTPAVGIGESSRTVTQDTGTSTKSSSSSKDTAQKDMLDLIKMFKDVKGIKVDVSSIYSTIANIMQEAEIFGKELNSQQIATMYLRAMQQLNNVSRSKEIYDKAYEVAAANGALNEIAVNSLGQYAVQDRETAEIKMVDEIDLNKYIPLTNSQLLTFREFKPELAFNRGDTFMQNVVANGVGLSKIGKEIKDLAGTIGSTEGQLEGLSRIESNKVKAGIALLLNPSEQIAASGSPDGDYSITVKTKEQKQQIQAAMDYIKAMLPRNYKAVMNAHGGEDAIIQLYLRKGYTSERDFSIDPLTGKAAANKNGSSGSGDENDMIPSMAFFNGMGEKSTFVIQDKTSDGLKINTVSTTITSQGHNTGSITFDKLEASDFGGQLLINQATMGDTLISPVGRNNIIIDGRIYQAELPIDKAAKAQGIIKPDLKFLRRIEAADQKLRQMGIDKSDPANIATINKVYQENDLPILYTISDNKPVLTSEYARFAIVNGIGTEDAFGENPELNDSMIKEISDKKERQQFETLMQQISSNDKYKLDNGYGIDGLLSWGETKLYQGTIYIPMTTSNISALSGTGYKAKGSEYNEIEARQQAADAARQKGFKPANNNL